MLPNIAHSCLCVFLAVARLANDMNDSIRKLRQAMSNLESVVREEEEYITVKRMLELSERASESNLGKLICNICVVSQGLFRPFCSVGKGGLLLEAYLDLSAPFTTRRRWASVQKKLADNPSRDVSRWIDEIVQDAQNGFFFHVLSSLAARGLSAKKQLFYISLVMQHKGLSRSGLQLLSCMNLGLSPRSFDPLVELEEQRNRDMLR